MELREAWRREVGIVVMRLGKVQVSRSWAHGYRYVVGMGLCAVLTADMQICRHVVVAGCDVIPWSGLLRRVVVWCMYGVFLEGVRCSVQ